MSAEEELGLQSVENISKTQKKLFSNSVVYKKYSERSQPLKFKRNVQIFAWHQNTQQQIKHIINNEIRKKNTSNLAAIEEESANNKNKKITKTKRILELPQIFCFSRC